MSFTARSDVDGSLIAQQSSRPFHFLRHQPSLTRKVSCIAVYYGVSSRLDDRLVRIALQRWFTRVCEDPVVQRDDELRLFIESDFGVRGCYDAWRQANRQYNPSPPPSARRPASASASATNVLSAALSKVVRRGPLDEDEELAGAKGALEKLEGSWGGAAAAVGALGKARRGVRGVELLHRC